MKQPYLAICTPEGDYQLPLGRDPVTVGRHSENQLVVNDKLVSRFHCVIDCTAQGFVVRDLGASNPTVVNGFAVKSALLSNGDVIAVGSTQIVLVIPGAPPPLPRAEEPEVQAPSADLQALARAAGSRGAIEPSLSDADISALSVAGYVGGEDGEIEALTEADLIEDDPAPNDDFSAQTEAGFIIGDEGAIPVIVSDDDEPPIAPSRPHYSGVEETSTYRRDLRILADNAPDRPFAARDIALVDPHGETMASAHAGRGERGREILELLREILVVAFRSRASDIHLDPKGDSHLLRLRIDGVMMDAASIPQSVGEQLSRLVKVAAGIDPLLKGAVQEGHFVARIPINAPALRPSVKGAPVARSIDHRVSIAQTLAGQKWVIRILDPSGVPDRVKDLKFPAFIETELLSAVRPEPGMVLVCGPAGSGKTTTLYAMVRSIDLRRRNVITLEDPVESQIEGVSQLLVDADAGQSFPGVLRSVLRQDPDVVLISEIRDVETARLAIQAAASGRLVLSSIPANDSLGAVGRLIDMGVDRYLLAQGLRCVLSHRLIRELCPRCKKPGVLPPELTRELGVALPDLLSRATFFDPKGCRACFDTGYSGRRAVCEILVNRPLLQDALRRGGSIEELRASLAPDAQSLYPMNRTVYSLLAEGRTSASEATRVLRR